MVHCVEAVDLHVLVGPFKVVGICIDAYGGKSSAGCGMDRGAGSVAEQVQESFIAAHRLDHLSDRSVVEEEASIKIVGEVDKELVAVLVCDEEVRGTAFLCVLVGAFLNLAALNEDVVVVDSRCALGGKNKFFESSLCVLGVDGGRSRILLKANPLALVDVDGGAVLGHVSIIEAVACHTFLCHFFSDGGHVLLQAVGGHLGSR